MKSEPIINKDRSKLKIRNKDIKNDLLNYLDDIGSYKGFSIKKSYIFNNNVIITKLLYNNKETTYNYMDDSVRSLCSIIALDLRDIIGKSIFFDLRKGEFYFYV
tara:strand:+ start:91 stop:402 length:312 start_codon:yes stop_codon:yes gene_type:complete